MDGTYKASGAPRVGGKTAAYAGQVSGANVTIVLAEFYGKHTDDDLLQRVAQDAVRLSADLK